MIRKALAATVSTLLASAVLATPAEAWSPRTRLRMAEDAVRLMPRSLRALLAREIEAVRRGALEPMTEEGSPPHLPPWQDGTLPDEVAARSSALTAAIDDHAPFREIALAFGRLAHFVADAGYPPLAGGSGDEARYRHFEALVEGRLEKIPLVFYGHGAPLLERGDARGFALAVLEQARSEDVELARAYRAAGETPHPSAFDDRSVPFAIGSLAYSRTVTHVVNAWLDAWQRAHGDLGRTPYLDPKDPPRILDEP